VRDRLRGATDPLLLDARGYALPSPLLPVHAEVAAYARGSFPAGRPVAEGALQRAHPPRLPLRHRILDGRQHRSRAAGPRLRGVPGLRAPRGRGAAGDGLAARYVSGYLETTLAHGRDYADVAPLKGVIFADAGEGVMEVAVDMIRVDRG